MESFSTRSVNTALIFYSLGVALQISASFQIHVGLLKAEDAKTICLTEEELGNSCVFA